MTDQPLDRDQLIARVRAEQRDLARALRDTRVRAGRTPPRTRRELDLAETGEAERAAHRERKARRVARRPAADDPRPGVDPVDLDGLTGEAQE